MAKRAQMHGDEGLTQRAMGDLGSLRRVRFGLAAKITVPVTVAVVVSIVTMGMSVYRATEKHQSRQFDEQGVFAARIAASPEIDSWERSYNTLADLYRRTANIEASLEIASSPGTAHPSLTSAEAQRLSRVRDAFDQEQRIFNGRRLEQLIGSLGALDVFIVAGEDRLVMTASGRDGRSLGVPEAGATRTYALAGAPETAILEGPYRIGSGNSTPARYFRHPIRNRKGSVVGAAYVVVSMSALIESQSALATMISWFCGAAISVAAIVAFLATRWVTKPLGALLRDVDAVAAGDLEHRTRPQSTDEVGVLAAAFERMTRNLSRAEVLRVDLAEKEHQISVAQEIQERLFPAQLPRSKGLDVTAANRLAGELSSDLFDALVLPSGSVGVLVMTASGHGIPAAIVLSMARSVFRTLAPAHESPAEALRALNRVLAPDLRRGMYVSAFYAILNPSSGSGWLASAGHRLPALHFLAEKNAARRVTSDGMAMGLDRGPVFDQDLTETALTLSPGDLLVLASEGAALVPGAEGAPLGEDGLTRTILRGLKQGADAAALLKSLLSGEVPPHDVTITVVRRDMA